MTRAPSADAGSSVLTVSGNLLLIDDLFDTGASMEAACAILRGIEAIGSIYVAALTCK